MFPLSRELGESSADQPTAALYVPTCDTNSPALEVGYQKHSHLNVSNLKCIYILRIQHVLNLAAFFKSRCLFLRYVDLLHHSSRVPGSVLSSGYSPWVSVGFLWVLQVPPSSQKHAITSERVCEWYSMMDWQPIQAVFAPHGQYSWDRLWIDRNSDWVVTEDG